MPTSISTASAIALSLAAVLALALVPAGARADGPPPTVSPATDAAQAGMLDVAAIAPGLQLDMRYAGADNFTGRPVPGYEAPVNLMYSQRNRLSMRHPPAPTVRPPALPGRVP